MRQFIIVMAVALAGCEMRVQGRSHPTTEHGTDRLSAPMDHLFFEINKNSFFMVTFVDKRQGVAYIKRMTNVQIEGNNENAPFVICRAPIIELDYQRLCACLSIKQLSAIWDPDEFNTVKEDSP